MEREPQWAVHTDEAELGWKGTGGPDKGPGKEGIKEESGIWSAEERKDRITMRELKAVALVIGRRIGVDVRHDDVRNFGLTTMGPNMSSR